MNYAYDVVFVTPFRNGIKYFYVHSNDHVKSLKLAIGCPSSFEAMVEKTDKKLEKLIFEGKIPKRVVFENYCNCSSDMRKMLEDLDVKVSSSERGWFPHYKTITLDPWGFSSKSLISQSRLDDVEFDEEQVTKGIRWSRGICYGTKDDAKIDRPYILLVLQHTRDNTLQYDFPSFISWQKIIDFVHSIREPGELLVIKKHPCMSEYKTDLTAPPDAIITDKHILNFSLLENANMVIGINSTMLYEASILFNRSVVGFGESWFNGHPEIIKKVKFGEPFERPVVTEKELEYRKKFYHLISRTQVWIERPDFIEKFFEKHDKVSQVKTIKELASV